jgi:hypothetical protein
MLKDDRTFIPTIQKIEKNGITSTSEMMEVFEAVARSSYSEGESSVINDMTKGRPVGNFSFLPCSICGLPIEGLLIDNTTEIASWVKQALRPPVHPRCNRGRI